MAIIKLKNPKILTFLQEKDVLITQGRKISESIEKKEKEIEKHNDKERAITTKAEPLELIAKGDEVNNQINILLLELEKVANAIQDFKLAAIPQAMKDKHYALKEELEKMRIDRNKIALKVQKIKDRVSPLVKKEVAPHLGEFDDTETVQIIKGQVVVQTFSHLEEWKAGFKKKQKQTVV